MHITYMRLNRATLFALLIALGLWRLGTASLRGYVFDPCDVCGRSIGDTVYLIKDKVAQIKKRVCTKCSLELPDCFLCGVPALTNATGTVRFEDGRTLCARDAKDAVVEEEEGRRIFAEVRDQLERQFSRHLPALQRQTSFVTIDRLHLENLFKIVGHDYDCPNVYGLARTKTNDWRLEHEISVLIGLPRGDYRAVCAHEYAHTWLDENVAEARLEDLSQPAREGFCELIAFLCMDALHDESAKSNILANAYTRGQIALFVEVERCYGLNDIVDWMKHGVDERLEAGQLGRIRAIEAPAARPTQPAPARAVTWKPQPARTYDSLVLKAIFWDPRQPTALVNERTLAPGEEVVLRIGATNVTVRCLQIQKEAVRIRLAATGEEQTLHLKPRN